MLFPFKHVQSFSIFICNQFHQSLYMNSFYSVISECTNSTLKCLQNSITYVVNSHYLSTNALIFSLWPFTFFQYCRIKLKTELTFCCWGRKYHHNVKKSAACWHILHPIVLSFSEDRSRILSSTFSAATISDAFSRYQEIFFGHWMVTLVTQG